jgi:hypothetical protein
MTEELVSELKQLIEDWEEEPTLYNPNFTTDLMQNTVQNECANELRSVLESYD